MNRGRERRRLSSSWRWPWRGASTRANCGAGSAGRGGGKSGHRTGSGHGLGAGMSWRHDASVRRDRPQAHRQRRGLHVPRGGARPALPPQQRLTPLEHQPLRRRWLRDAARLRAGAGGSTGGSAGIRGGWKEGGGWKERLSRLRAVAGRLRDAGGCARQNVRRGCVDAYTTNIISSRDFYLHNHG
jgi:hypothetical protein